MAPSERPARGDVIFLIVMVVLICAVVIGTAVVTLTRPDPVQIVINPPQPTITPAPTATRQPILVYVSGAVNHPNTLISLPYGSRVQDAITAAGGLTEDAVLSSVNLAGILRDGDQIHVASTNTANEVPTPLDASIVYINSATIDQLVTLPGIGLQTAAAIIAYREANGPFADLAALDAVDGIGPRTLETLAPLIDFD